MDLAHARPSLHFCALPAEIVFFFVHFGWERPEMQRAPEEAKCKLGAFLVKIWSVRAFLSVLESSGMEKVCALTAPERTHMFIYSVSNFSLSAHLKCSMQVQGLIT